MEGANLSSTNRKITKRKKIDEEVPTNIEGVPAELNYFIPDDEGEEDFSPFTELLEEAEEEEQAGDEEEDEDMEEEGAETIYSSGEGTERAQDEQEETENKDDPMEGSPKEEPDTKRRKLAEMIEAIPITAEAHGACLACGLAGHSMSECKNTEDREKIANAFEVILSKVKKRHSPKPEEHTSRQKAKDREEPREEIPERMISRYVDSKYIQCDFESIPEVSRQFYLTELTRTLPFREACVAHKDGVRYPKSRSLVILLRQGFTKFFTFTKRFY